MNPFRSKYKITQSFGVNPDYYKQFGLKAHEGIDIIPTGGDWSVYCLADGVVVRDEDDARSGAYGINLTIWRQKLNKATQYCHLAENSVTLGDIVTGGQKIGVMGNTGNTAGFHLHLNLFETDVQGTRLNRNNGYFGGIDPLPFLESEITTDDPSLQLQYDACRTSRDNHWTDLQDIKNALALTGEYSKDAILNRIDGLMKNDQQIGEKDKQLREAQEQIQQLREEVSQHLAEATKSRKTAEKLQDDYSILEGKYKGVSDELERLNNNVTTSVHTSRLRGLLMLLTGK